MSLYMSRSCIVGYTMCNKNFIIFGKGTILTTEKWIDWPSEHFWNGYYEYYNLLKLH
jgi:hypothetical protein